MLQNHKPDLGVRSRRVIGDFGYELVWHAHIASLEIAATLEEEVCKPQPRCCLDGLAQFQPNPPQSSTSCESERPNKDHSTTQVSASSVVCKIGC